jgi:hypothetical protein
MTEEQALSQVEILFNWHPGIALLFLELIGYSNAQVKSLFRPNYAKPELPIGYLQAHLLGSALVAYATYSGSIISYTEARIAEAIQ